MKRLHLGALLLAVPTALVPAVSVAASGGQDATPAPLIAVEKAEAGTAVPSNYIVTLKPGVDAEDLAGDKKVKPRHLYSKVINGFAAKLTPGQLDSLRRDGDVAAIEEDQTFRADTTQPNAPWGLDRIDQRSGRDGNYTYTRNGSGVTAYVIDTGIDTGHADFGGRARNVFDAFGGNGADCHGHGTHVAGTVGGNTYGVAKGVQLRGVKVLNCQGSGSTSGIVAGFDWVRQNAVKPAVANASLGGGYSTALNNAATNLANSGVHLAVAAGNENQDACNVSPASATGPITVAASDSGDRKASFSNYGSCTDIYAPGVSITSARMGGGSTAMSGTSMASPHVAGVAALYKANHGDASSATVNQWLVANSTTGAIGGNVGSTPNKLLFKAGL
ncbi:S8 family peptidase [Streptomyces sp. NPDC018031]|uniref:S8 family peptidase n=1 Tax=Streptomyces sp. NPDC018031 TaxID=3365033 RepID=UPI0037BB1C67